MTTALSDAVASELRGHLSEVCAQIGVDPAGARLVKYTMNAVFVAPPFVIRLAAGPHAAALARRVVSVAACLEKAGMPTVRLASGVASQPILSGEWVCHGVAVRAYHRPRAEACRPRRAASRATQP